MKEWFVYIVECSDSTYYTGITTNIIKRIETHNSKKGAKYTKSRTPVTLKYSNKFGNKSEASKEEYRIKQLTRLEKEQLWNCKIL
ncbi:GIY-YIG nuclease family protein [Candidatus Dojkabacteria bacterium]|jgi:putative endonuclease|nr:GIY-YIG nuclease family protein [Candidatus Dojkabacteria bacterium]